MKEYNPAQIEKKWQKVWARKKIYKTSDDLNKPKYYVLDMFPYPSGEGLHVGHPKGYIATDVVSRMKRMQGFNVLHPMGFDAFGLPAENYAIKTKTNPVVAVKKNVARYKEQLQIIGFDYDWSREINTTDPKYYKWTQWIFLKLLEKGLAYESNEPVDWCPVDKTVLAKEDIENGCCERCGTPVEKKLLRQWVLKITDYADRLLSDIDTLDWPESIKESQRNWIGRSEGVEIDFSVKDRTEKIKIFTTRADTLFGVTYIVLAPEHPLVLKLTEDTEVLGYIERTKKKTEIERTDTTKEKIGVEIKDIKAINPATGEEIPVWVADYVLADYGTGAVMAVPAHDERDAQFAEKYKLPVKEAPEASEEVISKFGIKTVKYKLRDWVFSRQRYWGEPIPVFHTPDGTVMPVSEKELPVELPKVKYYEPTGTGESPLAGITRWSNVKRGKEIWKRESNTMPQWAGSSWYYLRYMDPKNKKVIVDSEKEKYWNEVDLYVGGAEHATRHLIYARFWHKFLYDIGVVSNKEPFKRLQHVGLIMAEDGRKMSKRYGNVINPDEIIKLYGADSLRLYELFMGPFDQSITWSTKNMIGVRRFIEKVWRLQEKLVPKAPFDASLETVIHKTMRKVSEDIERMQFNTAVSALMIMVNEMDKKEQLAQSYYIHLLQLLAPFAPHITEEIWSSMKKKKTSIHQESWPIYNPSKIVENKATIAIQINGKTRSELDIQISEDEQIIKDRAQSLPDVQKWIVGKKIIKVIYVKGRLVNIVIHE